MKSHTFADALLIWANKLKAGPNVEVADLTLAASEQPASLSTQNITVGLSLLLQLSKVNKQEWVQFVREHSIPIAVEQRDSSRNVLGKLLNYLDSHPEAQKNLSTKSLSSSETSPKLAKALQVLMGD
jgi:hypothetical protein